MARTASVTLFAATSNDDITRREAMNTLTTTAAGMASASIYTSKVNAEEDGGKLIEFTVNNLDGMALERL